MKAQDAGRDNVAARIAGIAAQVGTRHRDEVARILTETVSIVADPGASVAARRRAIADAADRVTQLTDKPVERARVPVAREVFLVALEGALAGFLGSRKPDDSLAMLTAAAVDTAVQVATRVARDLNLIVADRLEAATTIDPAAELLASGPVPEPTTPVALCSTPYPVTERGTTEHAFVENLRNREAERILEHARRYYGFTGTPPSPWSITPAGGPCIATVELWTVGRVEDKLDNPLEIRHVSVGTKIDPGTLYTVDDGSTTSPVFDAATSSPTEADRLRLELRKRAAVCCFAMYGLDSSQIRYPWRVLGLVDPPSLVRRVWIVGTVDEPGPTLYKVELFSTLVGWPNGTIYAPARDDDTVDAGPRFEVFEPRPEWSSIGGGPPVGASSDATVALTCAEAARSYYGFTAHDLGEPWRVALTDPVVRSGDAWVIVRARGDAAGALGFDRRMLMKGERLIPGTLYAPAVDDDVEAPMPRDVRARVGLPLVDSIGDETTEPGAEA